jgi:NDP-sugar pyrophosphorylase family protein
MVSVLITTSGTGSRLENLTINTNKSLLPVGDKYAICHIIDSYPKNTKFIVTLGYFGNHVRDFLELAYPSKKIEFVYIDKYEGAGSSLGMSMLKAKKHLQTPFIFHCCDTITNPINITDNTKNILFVNKNDDYYTYSSINVQGDKVITMNNKGVKDNDYIYTGLCYIKDFEEFWKILEKLYDDNPNYMALSDIHAIQIMLQQNIAFSYNVIECYFDTGNMNSYTKTCNKFTSKYNILVKSTESLCFLDDRIIKFVNDMELNRKRVIRGTNLYPHVPKILDSRSNFIVMEFIEGKLLAEYKKHGEINNLLEWAQNNLWIEKDTNDKYYNCCINFYKTKTFDRIKKIPFLDTEKNVVNSINIGSIYTLLDRVDFSSIATTKFTKFHGDFILDNIIKKGDNDYCLLDWRHEFDTEINYGDLYYDLAKLRHNMILNHSNILNDLYNVDISNDEVYIDLKCNYILVKQLEEYNQFIKKYDYNLKKVEILTAIIWLNMAPLYDGKFRDFLFYFGKFNLYLALK